MAELKDFRHAVSVLKKQGLISGRTSSGQKIDARSALPNWKIKGKKLSTLVKKYDDVVTGKATAVKVPPKTLKQFRKSGFETANKRVLVPHSKSETAQFKGGEMAIKNKSGIERVQIPVEYQNLNQYLRDLKKNSELINRMKKRNEYFGIRFFGGQRAQFYSDIESLIADLSRYEDIQKVTSRAKQSEIYKNLEILRMNRQGAETVEHQIHERKRTRSKEYNRRAMKRYRNRIKSKPRLLAKKREGDARRMREYRKRMKGPRRAHYLKQAKIRSKKAKAKKKTRKGKKK
jgi:hypothetical protein